MKDVFRVSEYLPKTEQFGITMQMKKSSVSIVSNIDEGASRKKADELLGRISEEKKMFHSFMKKLTT